MPRLLPTQTIASPGLLLIRRSYRFTSENRRTPAARSEQSCRPGTSPPTTEAPSRPATAPTSSAPSPLAAPRASPNNIGNQNTACSNNSRSVSLFERRRSSMSSHHKSRREREVVLVFGGIDPHSNEPCRGADVLGYHRRRDCWRRVAEMPEPRHHHSVVWADDGRVYLAGGSDPREDAIHKSIAVGTVWSYDPQAKTWRSEANMLTCRQNFGLVASDGKIFAIGGQSSDGTALKTVEAFDPSAREWTERRSMRIARVGPATVKYDARIWVAGGMTNSAREPISRDVECYDTIANVWHRMAALPSPRCFSCLHVVADRLLIIGGASETRGGCSVESVGCIDVWEASRCGWQRCSELRTARHGHAVTSIGNQLLVLGGVTTQHTKALKSVECYCLAQDNWIKGISSLPFAISGHGVVSLPSANLLAGSQSRKINLANDIVPNASQ